MAINTYYRIDEILAGCILAFVYEYENNLISRFFSIFNPVVLLMFLFMSAHPFFGHLNYLRPYIAMLTVGSTLFNDSFFLHYILKNRVLVYMATVSYALYIFHGVFMHTWLGDGDKLVKYAKRPLLFAATFLLAHFSTFYYEKFWIDLGKRMTQRRIAP